MLHHTFVHVHNLVCPSPKKAHHKVPWTSAQRQLRSAAVMCRSLHTQNRSDFYMKTANPPQSLLHLPLLPPQLSLIAHVLQLTPSARGRVGTGRVDAVWRCLLDFHQPAHPEV